MPLYKYKVTNDKGETSEHLIEGNIQADALEHIRNRGFIPVAFLGEQSLNSTSSFFSKNFDVCDFTNKLAPLLKAQIPLEKAFSILVEGTDDNSEKEVIGELRRGLHEGKKFSQLISANSRYFPKIYRNLVEAGEETGSLPEVILELQRYLNSKKKMKDFLITSSLYPILILLVTFCVVIFLFTVLLPRFSKMFADMGKELPALTSFMLDISYLFTNFWYLWITLPIITIITIRQLLKQNNAFFEMKEKFILSIPILGKLIHFIEINKFIRTLSILVSSNVHILTAVEISLSVVENLVISKSLGKVSLELRGGGKLSSAIKKSKWMPLRVPQMVTVGEEFGETGKMLEELAEYYDDEIKNKLKKILTLFEPLVIIILAVVVLMVVVSIFLAILEMNNV